MSLIFRIDCAECGATLNDTAEYSMDYDGDVTLKMAPCDTCLQSAHEDGIEKGKIFERWEQQQATRENIPGTPEVVVGEEAEET